MPIDYRETTNDLLTRIDIHKRFGGRDIDQWMLHLLNVQKGARILDIGCGAGKQCFLFLNALEGQADITGGDVNEELLAKARQENERSGGHVRIITLNFNERFPLEDNTFDLETSCFAIYYAENIPFTIGEAQRVLKPGGRLFTTGPMPENKRLFYEIIQEATHKSIPPMPGSSRYSSQIFNAIQERFSNTEMHIFENPLTFEEVQPFIDYVRASLSEDRRLWKDLFDGAEAFQGVIDQITAVAARRLEEEGKLVMTKVVGGILATK